MEENKNTILVPVNFTEHAENGAVYALQIAAGINADITLLNAYFNPVLTTPGAFEPYSYMMGINVDMNRIEEETLLNLEAVKLMLESKMEKEGITNVRINVDMVQGFATESILAWAEEYNPDVIIMGTSEKASKQHTPFGKKTFKILESANVPVIAVPFGYDAYQFRKPEKVLYLTNIDNTDYDALERLTGFARFYDAKIICIHTSEVESDKEDEIRMKKIKSFIVDKLGNTNIECGILESADLQKGLDKFIKERKVDILAFSTHKRNLLMKFFTQDIDHRFLYQTDIPLLVYHAK